jgi:hypothetical protein
VKGELEKNEGIRFLWDGWQRHGSIGSKVVPLKPSVPFASPALGWKNGQNSHLGFLELQ